MKRFAISDLHFGHENVLKYEPIRSKVGESVKEMDHNLIKRWNSIVSTDDHVYIVGDFSFHDSQTTRNILSTLNGHKHLIVGNHDFHYTTSKLLSMGFSSVQMELKLQLAKDVFVKLNHFPYKSQSENLEFERGDYSSYLPSKEDGVWLIHGHSHSKGTKFSEENKSICVSVELWNFYPVNLDTLVGEIRKSQSKGQ